MIPVFLDSARKHKNLARTYKNWLPDADWDDEEEEEEDDFVDEDCNNDEDGFPSPRHMTSNHVAEYLAGIDGANSEGAEQIEESEEVRVKRC
jgi:hypothetical protein